MSKLSKFFATLSSACAEQHDVTLQKLTPESDAQQARKIAYAANNLLRQDGVNSASTSHAEQLEQLAKLVSDKTVATMFRDCEINASAIASLAKYNKAKINATFRSVASNVVPDWTRNDQNAFAFFELLRKHGTHSVTFQQIQRFLKHKTLTQSGYIARFWSALGVAHVHGKANERVLKANQDSKLYKHIAALYGIDAQQDNAEQDAQQDAQQDIMLESAQDAQESME